MKKLGVIGAVVVFISLIYLFCVLIISITNSKAEVQAGVITALISVGGLIWSKQAEKIKEIENTHRIEKIKNYQKFLDILFDKFLYKLETGQNPDDKEVKLELIAFQKNLIIWGSDEVIKVFNSFTIASVEKKNSLIEAEKLLLALRKDLGHRDKMNDHEILKLIIKAEERNKLNSLLDKT